VLLQLVPKEIIPFISSECYNDLIFVLPDFSSISFVFSYFCTQNVLIEIGYTLHTHFHKQVTRNLVESYSKVGRNLLETFFIYTTIPIKSCSSAILLLLKFLLTNLLETLLESYSQPCSKENSQNHHFLVTTSLYNIS
jgi:hypothetical protein